MLIVEVLSPDEGSREGSQIHLQTQLEDQLTNMAA